MISQCLTLFILIIQRLGASKLQALFKDLQEQDKIEITYKKLKTENHDKDGLKEMETRSKLNVILAKYDLRDVLETINEDKKPIETEHHKQLFKDKNLDKLWNKALQSKFSDEELKILKEEFQHYEAKLEDYHKLIDKVHELEDKLKNEQEKWKNSVERLDDEHEFDKSTSNKNHLQHLNEKHRAVKESYFKLQDKVLRNVELDKSRLFEDDDAQKLWEAAEKAGFDETELLAIKSELLHFEHRVKKLSYLHEHISSKEYESKFKQTMENADEHKLINSRIRELTQQIEKLRNGIETRIKVQRHSEL